MGMASGPISPPPPPSPQFNHENFTVTSFIYGCRIPCMVLFENKKDPSARGNKILRGKKFLQHRDQEHGEQLGFWPNHLLAE